MTKYYTVSLNKKGEVRLKNDHCTYTYEIYKGDLTDFYEIVKYYRTKFKGVGWVDTELPGKDRGYLMTIEEWKESCDDGGFIDYDGYGSVLDENYSYLKSARPSGRNKIPKESKYIHWYNK